MDWYDEFLAALGSGGGGELDTAMMAAGSSPVSYNPADYSGLDAAMMAAGSTPVSYGGSSDTPFYLRPGFLQGAGSAIGGLSQAYAGQRAAGAQVDAADRALALQERIYNSMAARNQGAETLGNLARNRYGELVGLGPNTNAMGYGSAVQPFTMQGFNPSSLPPNFSQADLESDVIRQDALRNANRATDRNLASRGLFLSPQRATAEMANRLNTGESALRRFQENQDRQSGAFNRAYNYSRQNRADQLGPLSDLMTGGTNATNATNTAMGNYGTNAANLMGQAGQATGAGYLGAGSSVNNLFGALNNQYNTNQMMDILRESRRSSYG